MSDVHENKKLSAEYLTCQRFLKKLEYLAVPMAFLISRPECMHSRRQFQTAKAVWQLFANRQASQPLAVWQFWQFANLPHRQDQNRQRGLFSPQFWWLVLVSAC